jgi:hypothetical protein
MSTAQSLIDDVRARIVEATADFFADDVSLLRWLNQGYRNFCAQTEYLEKIKAFRMIANQYEYDVPSDMQSIREIRWQDKHDVDGRDVGDFNRYIGMADQLSDRPLHYKLFPSTTKIRLYPIPNAASASTTMNDAGGINTSDVTVTLTDASAFPSRGRILIENEQILFYAKSGNTLSQLVRADGGTTAASHADATTVYYAPLEVSYSYMPTAMTTGGSAVDCQLPVEYDEALIAYACAIAFRSKDKYEIAGDYRDAYKSFLEMGIKAVSERQRDFYPHINEPWSYENM